MRLQCRDYDCSIAVCYNESRAHMTNPDGVVEAVRYKGDRIELIRAYERRGPAFSDRVLLDRAALLARIREGKQFVTGQRRQLLAGTFDVGLPIHLVEQDGNAVLTTGTGHQQDRLQGVPIF
jgi:hypothetical protein